MLTWHLGQKSGQIKKDRPDRLSWVVWWCRDARRFCARQRWERKRPG